MPCLLDRRPTVKDEMKNTSMAGLGRLGRCMEQERAHQDGLARLGKRGLFSVSGCPRGAILRGNESVKMAARADPEGAIREAAGVEMKAHRD